MADMIKETVLVVDDNLSILRQVGVFLEGSYHVLLAKSGEQALAIVRERRPDLILLDVMMPGMDGFETMRRLSQDPVAHKTPVIFVTANHDSETEARALLAGALDFITKPVDRTVLLHRIRVSLDLSQYQLSLEDTVRELEYSIAYSFAGLLGIREPGADRHSRRTGVFLRAIGEALLADGVFAGEGFDSRRLDLMAHAMPLHDVGKIGVSDTILQKPEPLTPQEFDIAKTHTAIGAGVLQGIYDRTPDQEYLAYAAQMAHWHHERYDGAGYPDGLAGDAIPLCCRIAAVANAYDVLVCERVYRAAVSHDEACALIAAGRGTAFDPRVVDGFERASGSLLELRRQFETQLD